MKVKSIYAAPFLVLVVLALMALSNLLDDSVFGTEVNPYLAYIILQMLVYAIPALFFCRMRGGQFFSRLRLHLFKGKHLSAIFCALIVLVAGSSLINFGMYRLFPSMMESAADSVVRASGFDFYMVLAVCVFPAVLEEFLFRSVITVEYEAVNVPFAVFASSLLFAMIHLNLYKLPSLFFSGIVLALIMYATRSVAASMLVHILNNIAVLFLEPYIKNAASVMGTSSILVAFILTSVLLLAMLLLFWQLQRIYEAYGVDGVPAPYVRRRKKKEPSSVIPALSAPPFVLFVLLFLVFSILKL